MRLIRDDGHDVDTSAGPGRRSERTSTWGSVELVVLLVLGMFLLGSVAALGSGYRLVRVSGTSMAPNHPPGSYLLARPSSEAGVGDVITFAAPNGIPTVHRVVGVTEGSEYRTRGDNNRRDDPWLVPASSVAGRAVVALSPADGARLLSSAAAAFAMTALLGATLGVVAACRRTWVSPLPPAATVADAA